jgi:hypothetical protein
MTVAPGVDTTGIDVAAAKATYFSLVTLADRAVKDPSRDWSHDYYAYAIDPAASDLLHELEVIRDSGVRFVGHSSYTATLMNAAQDQIDLRVCVDNRGQDIQDSQGNSVKSGRGGSHPQNASLIRKPDGRWFVSEITGFPNKSC